MSDDRGSASPSLATAAGFVDRETFVSYWVDATRDLQSSNGCYSLDHASILHDQLFTLKAKLFEAARFVDADLCQHLDAMDEETAAAIRVQKAVRGRAGASSAAARRATNPRSYRRARAAATGEMSSN